MNPSDKSAQANRLLNSKCHYEVLGVNITANKREIRKAFRQLALKYHPDKNELPQAKDVFHRIVSAYEVLEDDKLKKVYDQNKNKPNQVNQESKGFKNQSAQKKHSHTFKASSKPANFSRKFEEQSKKQFRRQRKPQSPIKEKRYQQFSENKNKSSPIRPTYKSQFIPQRQKEQSSRSKNCRFLLILLVFILIFYFSPFNNRSIEDRHLFSLTPTVLHNIKMKTQKIKAPYYIKTMQNTSAQISQQLVQRMYIRKLQKQCQIGLSQRQSFQKMAARSLIISVQSTYLSMAKRVDIQSCKKIIKLLKKYPFIQLSIFQNNLQL